MDKNIAQRLDPYFAVALSGYLQRSLLSLRRAKYSLKVQPSAYGLLLSQAMVRINTRRFALMNSTFALRNSFPLCGFEAPTKVPTRIATVCPSQPSALSFYCFLFQPSQETTLEHNMCVFSMRYILQNSILIFRTKRGVLLLQSTAFIWKLVSFHRS